MEARKQERCHLKIDRNTFNAKISNYVLLLYSKNILYAKHV